MDDPVGAFVPHGRFQVAGGSSSGSAAAAAPGNDELLLDIAVALADARVAPHVSVPKGEPS